MKATKTVSSSVSDALGAKAEIESDENTFYITTSRVRPWSGDSVPDVEKSYAGQDIDYWFTLLGGELVEEKDVSMMARVERWRTGRKWKHYDHRRGFSENFAGEDMEMGGDAVWSVEGDRVSVFRCIHNGAVGSGNNAVVPYSTERPLRSHTRPDDGMYVTSDGYQWKFLYDMSLIGFEGKRVGDWIPVQKDNAVASSAVSGSLDAITVDSPGLIYDQIVYGDVDSVIEAGRKFRISAKTKDADVMYVGGSGNDFSPGDAVVFQYAPGKTIRHEDIKGNVGNVSAVVVRHDAPREVSLTQMVGDLDVKGNVVVDASGMAGKVTGFRVSGTQNVSAGGPHSIAVEGIGSSIETSTKISIGDKGIYHDFTLAGDVVSEANAIMVLNNSGGEVTVGDANHVYLGTSVKAAMVKTSNTSISGNVVEYQRIDSESAYFSADQHYYDGYSFYVTSGPGAGEVSTIDAYEVNAIASVKEHVVTLSSNISAIDPTSRFAITPGVRIRGDGTNAKAIAMVDRRGISAIRIIGRGENYTRATVELTTNSEPVRDTDEALATVMISPPGGHGSNVFRELNSCAVAVSRDIQPRNESMDIDIGKYHQIALLKNPKYANAKVELNTAEVDSEEGNGYDDNEKLYIFTEKPPAVPAANAIAGGGKYAGKVIDGQLRSLNVTDALGRGLNDGNNWVLGASSNTRSKLSGNVKMNAERAVSAIGEFDQRTRLNDVALVSAGDEDSFKESGNEASHEDGDVSTALIAGGVFAPGNNRVYLTEVDGDWLAIRSDSTPIPFRVGGSANTATFGGKTSPDMIPQSGEVVHVENLSEMERDSVSVERVKFLLRY